MRTFQYDTHVELATHLNAFVTAYNFARRLTGLRCRTPFQAICDAGARDPTPFKLNPHDFIPGPNS